jgi:hypothetical protein
MKRYLLHEQHENTGVQDAADDFAAQIFDLRGFFENTRYCGKTCKKMAYMVKYGRRCKGCYARFLM